MQPNQTHSNTTQPKQALIDKINSTVVKVYTNNGQTVNTGDPRFTMNSAWKVNRVVKNSQGKSFYLVGNDTWISSDDMELNQAPQDVENIPNFGIINSNNSGNVNNGSGSNNTASNSITHEPESAYQSAIIDVINTKRSALGLPPLTVSAKLTRAATIRTSEQYNTNQRETRPTRPDGSNWWSVLSEVDYDWSYARENNFVITDSTTKREDYRYPENIASGLMSLYSDTYEGNYLSPKAKEIGVSVRYNDDGSKIFTIIEVGAPR
ncbi:MAG: hypothetical protein J6584_08965 [Lactobacillus sp.]|nr:hypothetical protein [Lactobacillus sp.]